MDAKNPALDVQTILAFIIESVSWVTEDFLWDHEWITETKVTMKENLILEALHYDIEALLCSVGSVMVLSTNKSQPQVREQWNKCGQSQGHGQQRNRADV